MAIRDGSRLAGIVGEPEALVVNSYHHQAVTPDRLSPALVANALADHDGTMLVEGLEARDPDRWLIGVQCHPERTESSPVVLERLWSAFVAAARGPPPPRGWNRGLGQPMQTVRRLYLYLMSGISLGVLLVGLNILLTVVFHAAGLGRGEMLAGEPDRQAAQPGRRPDRGRPAGVGGPLAAGRAQPAPGQPTP